ncbi:GNAT family N-acetyltransferase [Tissierella sp. Yu-01]|uniref:GNAT family N-acetyltransferase n=1 Tax=Tissierella sp. Yu-01 TaxID=3035694 RepID=UPI00240D1FF4|nr:GNAT family N-acetyltransferase [Tissierella sp. Yu-01]WFA07822.1 GNAT family N-acetyltransferase [Tissierella sp. Yu-01]
MLETDRCILRPFEERDLDSFMTYRNNEEWMKYQSFKNLTKEQYRETLLVPLNIDNGVQLAISGKISDNLLGDIFLAKKEKAVTIGYSINPTHSRKGYISEVLKVLLPKLKVCYPDCKIIAMTERENIPSKNLLIKLGFIYRGWMDDLQSEIYVYSN